MKEKENLVDIAEQVKGVDANINSVIVPILKDTIKDGNKHNSRLFILAVIELIIILITVFTSIFFVYRQNIKYQEFLSQFEFDTEVYQDTDDNSIINSGINVNK